MEFNIDDLVKSFETKSKKDKDIFNDFLYHCYLSFDKVVKSNRIRYKGVIHNMITNGEMPEDISPPEYTMQKIINQMTKGQPTDTQKKLPDKTVKRLEAMAARTLKAKAKRNHGRKKK